MKKATKPFNFGLFTEGLRQTRGLALTAMFIINLISVLLPSGIAVIYSESGADLGRLAINNMPNFIHLYLIFMVLAPVLAFRLFHFLNNRNACDYYHSIPHKRITIYISYIMASLFWVIVNIIVTATVTVITYLAFSQYFEVSILSILSLMKFCVSIFICSTLVISGVAIACAVTGSVVMSVILSFIFLVCPRLLIVLFTFIITAVSPSLAVRPTFFVLHYNTNLLYASVFSCNTYFISLIPMIYTFIIAIIYFIIGGIFFKKRSSELAGHIFESFTIQNVSGLLISLPISFFAHLILLFIITTIGSFEKDYIYFIITMLVFVFQAEIGGIIVLLLYTLLTSRKINSFRKILMPSGIYGILQVVIFLLVIIVYLIETNYTVSPGRIDYIRFLDYNVSEPIYEYSLKNDYKIKDEEIKELVADGLYNNVMESLFTGISTEYNYGEYWDITVAIKSGLTTKYRKIEFTKSKYQRIEYAFENTEYQNFYSTLPKYNTEKMSLSDPYDLSEDELLIIYKTLDNELDSINAGVWIDKINSFEVTDSIHCYYIEVECPEGTSTLPITNITPKTYELYENMIK